MAGGGGRGGWLNCTSMGELSHVRRVLRRAPPAGHDVAGPGLHLDLPDAQVRLAARFRIRGGDVAPYPRPVEKHAAVGNQGKCRNDIRDRSQRAKKAKSVRQNTVGVARLAQPDSK